MTNPREQYPNLPSNWKEIKKEINKLLSSHDPKYEKKIYLTPSLYIVSNKKKAIDEYPLLSKLHPSVQKRYVSYFLKMQGRKKRGSSNSKSQVWVLPGESI